jgi:succinate dehydrogenase / fumarate reductase, membrane anchor subunit
MGNGTGIGRVRGLGSARSGSHHWWMQRVTAAGNIILLLWFVTSLLQLPALDYETVVKWLHSPLVAVPMLLLTANVFWHLRLGLQVVLEDYQHDETKIGGLILLNFYAIALAALSIFSILKIAFRGTAG